MKRLLNIYIFLIVAFLMSACNDTYEEKQRITKAERQRMACEDSLALKVGVLPTLDCLPLFVAKDRGIFESQNVDVRLKRYNGQIDCDEALVKRKIEGMVSDLVRGQRLIRTGTPLRYVAATNAYWQYISNRKSRIAELKQMEDKMVAMARYSVTDMLADLCTDSVHLPTEYVFKVQINDPNVRLRMLMNNEMDAMLATEPQATAARLYKNPVLMDSRDKGMRMGVIAFSEKALFDKRRSEQLERFIKGYNMACDSINQKGLKSYADIIKKYTKADKATIDALPKMHYDHAAAPRKVDIGRAERWLK